MYPSRREPFGNVVLEAWGYGVPLVAAASTGPAWLVRDGEDAILAPVDDVAALAAGIRAVLDSSELRKTLVRNGKRRIAEEFSEPVIVARYVALLEDVAKRARPT